jgi:hypothetical protein
LFSLIITIVAIALVVALVAATMYHGGDTLTQGRASSTASELVSGAQQIAGAYRMSQALHNNDVASATELVSARLLASIPGRFDEFGGQTTAIWAKGKSGAPFAFIKDTNGSLTIEVCQALDKMAGRAPVVENDLPGFGDFAHYNAYGCYQSEGIGFYFKI